MRKKIGFLLFVFVLFFSGQNCRRIKRSEESNFNVERNNFRLQKRLHKLKEFSRSATKRLSILTDYSHFYNTYLKEILRVRVPGTVGHRHVKEFIARTLRNYGWKVELHNFEDDTPIGKKNFTNIVATLYPEADRVLALAAHYDSKLIPPVNGTYFVAATDSAVPCAILLDVARVLAQKANASTNAPRNVSPQMIFLDGEEAFVKWEATDSIYGSRHLAEEMSRLPHHNRILAEHRLSQLDAMDAFVLLDLLGAKSPNIPNFFGSTATLYNGMRSIEDQLRKADELGGCEENNCRYFTGQQAQNAYIEDDHIPFLRKNVPILHLIPVPFPDVWHTLGDDESVIDINTVENLLKIVRHFVCAYVSLE